MGAQQWSRLTALSSAEGLHFRGKPVSPAARLAAASSAAHVIGYWLPNLALYVIWKNKWLMQYKIQGPAMPSQQLINKELLENVQGTLLSIPLAAYLTYFVMARSKFTEFFGRLAARAMGKSSSSIPPDEDEDEGAGTTPGDDDHERRSWCNLRFSGESPPAWQYFSQLLVAYLIYDFLFYWTHRALHQIPGAYQAVHSTHHKFYASVGIAASYAHPVEHLTQLVAFYLPIAISGWLHRDLHIKIFFAYSIFRWVETVDAHCGYDLPFSPFALIPLFGSARQHDYHHAYVDGNFGASKIWDTLMGTLRS